VAQYSITSLGGFAVHSDGRKVSLPGSKRTRALLAYLAVTARPHRRDRLIELFWQIPDDPKGALRWSLSKLRQIIDDDHKRILADRERVALSFDDVDLDLHGVRKQLEQTELSVDQLQALQCQLELPFLEGLDLPDQELYQQWLTAERSEVNRLLAKVLDKLSSHAEITPDRKTLFSRQWLAIDPYNPKAANRLLELLNITGLKSESLALTAALQERFKRAGIKWQRHSIEPQLVPEDTEAVITRNLLQRQKIQFCTASDRVRLAYATVGSGYPIVKAANWLSHLELDWDAPIWSPLFRELAQKYCVVRYDERGNGLSDWDVTDISMPAFVNDLETVTNALALEKFSLLGISQGAAVCIEYAVKYPERVDKLILFGGYPAGWRINATADVIAEREAVMTLTKTGWGQANPAYRQIFSSTFLPSATIDELNWFNEFQRRTTSPENAARYLSAFGDIDVRDKLKEIKVPTLVIHSLGDRRIPVAVGRDLAASIPGAEFLGLESDGHLLLGREPASDVFVNAVCNFVKEN